jgi:hypothetical protein
VRVCRWRGVTGAFPPAFYALLSRWGEPVEVG